MAEVIDTWYEEHYLGERAENRPLIAPPAHIDSAENATGTAPDGNYGGTGAIVEYDVKVKPDPESPEVPMPGALVRLYKRHSGALAWEGVSNEQGKYTARGLRYGQAYIPMAIDLTETYEAVAAGPVIAGVDPVQPGEPVEPPERVYYRAALPSYVRAIIGQPFFCDVFFKQAGALQLIALTSSLPSGFGFTNSVLVAEDPDDDPGTYEITYQITDREGTAEVTQTLELVEP